MQKVFADSGYWIALIRPRDRLHDRARSASTAYADAELVTTQMVLVEVLAHASSRGTFLRKQATSLVQRLEADPRTEVVPQTDAQFQAAVERYERSADQEWSLTDCASFLVMKERGIDNALAFDDDFRQAGFRPLLREDSN